MEMVNDTRSASTQSPTELLFNIATGALRAACRAYNIRVPHRNHFFRIEPATTHRAIVERKGEAGNVRDFLRRIEIARVES